jgi:outer membrane protein assembly factor BamB
MQRRRGVAWLALAALLFAAVLGLRWLTAVPELRAFAAPAKTRAVPAAPAAAPGAAPQAAAVPVPDAFHTMHVDLRNGDEVWSVAGPVWQLEWLAEPELYVPEGPTFDAEGNLYFSPIAPREDVSLVALDRITGKRRWSVPGRGAGCGAPLVLNDPERPGHSLIHHSTYTTAMTLRPDGSVVWSAPTGLVLPTRRPGERDQTHVWGMSYVPPHDALVGVTMDGFVFAHDRRTGAPLLAAPFRLPGAPAAVTRTVPAWLARRANAETDASFGPTPDGLGIFTTILDVVFGNGVRVANFFAVDAATGRIFVAATAPDEQDGATDGVSANGAIYALELRGVGPGALRLEVVARFDFEGPTGSTPTLSADGSALFVSDDNGHVMKLDRELRERWRSDVGAQVAASIAVAAEGSELYAVTRYDVIRLADRGDRAEIVWRAQLDAYPGFDNVNALTATITANGVAISLGAGRTVLGQQLLRRFGVGLLDRETGRLRSFSEGREESIAVTAVGPDGAVYTAGSPVRRALTRALFGEAEPPLVGGITRYRPAQPDLLLRDAACAAAASTDPARSEVLLRQMRALLREMESFPALAPSLAAAAARLSAGDAAGAAAGFSAVCAHFE